MQIINKNYIRFHGLVQITITIQYKHHKSQIQLNHIWINVLEKQCKYDLIKAYWLDFNKLIYILSKQPNTLSIYNKKTFFQGPCAIIFLINMNHKTN